MAIPLHTVKNNLFKARKNCTQCQMFLKEYQSLYRKFESLETPELENDITLNVMFDLPEVDFKKQAAAKKSIYTLSMLLFVALAFLLGLIIATKFGTNKPWFKKKEL